jgi:S-adenosylmethionine:tRNA ribosyltransferase-isomerase
LPVQHTTLPAVPPHPTDPRAEDFDYVLPRELIAQTPTEPRDAACLLVLNRLTGRIEHRVFAELEKVLRPGDLLVANRTRVLPSRLVGERVPSGGRVEVLLLRQAGQDEWEALVQPGRRLKPGARILLGREGKSLLAEIGQRLPGGGRQIRISQEGLEASRLLALGGSPLPPYIKAWSGDPERYQTVYGDCPGSAAAPTAGLHFTPELVARLRESGIDLEFITLHIGPDTFRPIRVERLADHEMHAEWAEVSAKTLAAISAVRRQGGRVIVVGTTTVRALESVQACSDSAGWRGWTRLFIQPGHQFQKVDGLITNFHLPRSTLVVLVSALAGRERILAAYREAIRRRYRFYSFGDAMLIL